MTKRERRTLNCPTDHLRRDIGREPGEPTEKLTFPLSILLRGEIQYYLCRLAPTGDSLKEDFDLLTSELPTTTVRVAEHIAGSLVELGLATSGSEARRFLEQGAVYLNGQQISSDRLILSSDSINGFAIVRRGKNVNAVLQIED